MVYIIFIFKLFNNITNLLLNFILEYILSSVGNEIKNILKIRWKKIYHPVMSVAHLLDPKFCGKTLSTNSMTIIEQFIWKYYLHNATIIWEQLTNYQI